jgi:hypothetical protein
MLDLYYGLRNLSVGDEEETRISDLIDDVVPPARPAVEALIAIGDYDTAYLVALREQLKVINRERRALGGRELTRQHIEDGAAEWVISWNDEQGYLEESTPSTRAAAASGPEPDEDEEPEYDRLTVGELMAEYDRVIGAPSAAARSEQNWKWAETYAVITIDPETRAITDCEFLSGMPQWDWLALGQVVRVGNVNGGDSIPVDMPEENKGR